VKGDSGARPSRPRSPESAASVPPPPARAPLLAVENLTVALPAGGALRPAVDGVSLEVGGGESLALVGESGSGKTQLLRAVVGLSPEGARVSGRVFLGGRDLTSLPDAAWGAVRGGEVGMVFQEPASALDPVRTIGAQLEEALVLHGGGDRRARRATALAALAAVSFPDPEAGLGAYPHRLSGGLRQRACLAIALAPGPRLLLADEPTASLDATVALEILELLGRLRRERGMAVLLVTHDLAAVARHADRVTVLYAGRVVEEARPEKLARGPAHPYTLALWRSAPRLEAAAAPGRRYEAIPGYLADLAARVPRGCAFAPRCAERFAPCEVREPALYAVDGGRARCFLHEPAAGATA